MPEYYFITQGHRFWDETIALAERCSWRAGPVLAKKMRDNDFLEWEGVCVVRIDEKVVGFCTLSEKDELPEEYGFTPFIGFMFIDEPYREHRLSEDMIEHVIPLFRRLGYKKVYIMSGEVGLYEKFGFEKLGDYRTIYGSTDQLFVRTIA